MAWLASSGSTPGALVTGQACAPERGLSPRVPSCRFPGHRPLFCARIALFGVKTSSGSVAAAVPALSPSEGPDE